MAVRKKGAYRVVLTLDLKKQSSAIEVDVEDVGSFDAFLLTLKMDTDKEIAQSQRAKLYCLRRWIRP